MQVKDSPKDKNTTPRPMTQGRIFLCWGAKTIALFQNKLHCPTTFAIPTQVEENAML